MFFTFFSGDTGSCISFFIAKFIQYKFISFIENNKEKGKNYVKRNA